MSIQKIMLLCVAILVIIMMLIGSCTIVKPGHRGVLVTTGKVSTYVKGEGLHLKLPFIQKIIPVSVMVTQAKFENMSAASSSMQDVFTDVTLNYHINPERVNRYFVRFGKEPSSVIDNLIAAKLQELVKSLTNAYTTEQLLQRRTVLRDSVYVKLNRVAVNYDIVIDEFSMTNFRFSSAYQASIEEKQVMEQRALTAQRQKEVAQQEGEARIITARAEAEANRLKQAAITPQLIRYEEVMVLKEKWNGELPQVTGGAIPLLNLGN